MSAATLRVLTLNLQHGRPAECGHGSGAEGTPESVLVAAARQVASIEPDVVLLQEVDKHQRRSGGLDQTAVLARVLGLPYRRFAASFAGATDGWRRRPRRSDVQGAGYGVAILSRFPVASWHVRRLRRGLPRVRRRRGGRRHVLGRHLVLDEPRVCLAATVRAPDGPLSVAVTHLSTDPHMARRQLTECEEALATLPGPHLLGGDLNLVPADVAAVSTLRPLAHALTFTNRRPRRQIDHLLGSADLHAAGPAHPHHLAVSDHAGLSVEVQRHQLTDP